MVRRPPHLLRLMPSPAAWPVLMLCLLFGGPALADETPSKVVVFAPLTAHFGSGGEYYDLFRDDLEKRWNGRVETRSFIREIRSPDSRRQVALTLENLAADPAVAAVVIGEAPEGALEGIIRLRAERPDVLIFVLDPHESLERIGQAASLTLALNQTARGFLYPAMAARMGAGALIYLSYPRNHDIPALSRQHRVISAASRDMGLILASYLNGPDPMIVSREDLKKHLSRAVESNLALYGYDAAFMTTSSVYSELLAPIIARQGGALLEPIQPSLLLGLPEALGLSDESRNLFGHWRRLLTVQDEKYIETPPRGRFASWTYPYPHTAMLALVELAVGAIDRRTDVLDLKNVTSALEKHSPGVKWQATFPVGEDYGSAIPRVILVLEDTYWFGHGYQGFTRLNIPSRYYRIR